MPLLLPLMCLNAGLVALGCWLVFRSIHRIHHFEHRIKELSHKYRWLAQFIEKRRRSDSSDRSGNQESRNRGWGLGFRCGLATANEVSTLQRQT